MVKMDVQLQASNSSCAIDSVLVALFSKINRPLLNMLKMDNPLCDYFREIKKWSTIEKLRTMLPWHEERFDRSGAKDSGEFLTFLFDLFQDQVHVQKKLFQTISDEGIVLTSRVDYKSSPIQYISASDLNAKEDNFSISDLLCLKTINLFDKDNLFQSKYHTIITLERILEPTMVIFNVGRTMLKPINLSKTLNELTLHGIVCYTGGHYVSYIMKDDGWYFYDDCLPTKRYLGSFNKMLGHYPRVETMGVLYFYC